ncbi:hypothetical protein SAMN04489716_5784 [Actinoplanes derwentensis]|uniref:Membrane domain of glycerophosphoryl diester phosphodiesterase n=2 Tax=Actinoplanes derwentensis TaxID=113562 RepID=A0A1H2CGA5_9ACTN|nr:hypothetical protein SAMN04489716_5784 [Actinoplanes derwentensis]
MNQGWAERDGNGHYWPGQPPMIPPSFYATPADPLVSPDYAGWWRRSLTLARRVWKPALLLHTIAAVPSLALTVPADVAATAENREFQDLLANGHAGPAELIAYLSATALLLGAVLVAALIAAVVTAVNVHLVIQAATGQPVSLRAAATAGLRRAPAVIGWTLVANLLTSIAVLMCVLPVFYVGAALMALPILVTLERGSGISRAFSLFHADLGTSVARVATVFALMVAATIGLSTVAIALDVIIGGTAGSVAASLWNGVHLLVSGVFLTPLLVTAYADMRSRLEPFSTAYLMPHPTTPPP